MTADLVSRLLAAIDERERKARAAGSLQAMWWQPGGRNTIREFLADNDPDSVLRLCQAHRDIVAEYQRCGWHTVGYSGLRFAVEALARGYGVEDGEGDRG